MNNLEKNVILALMKDINSKLILPHLIAIITFLFLIYLEKTGSIWIQYILIALILGDLFCLFQDCERDMEKEITDALKEYEKNRS